METASKAKQYDKLEKIIQFSCEQKVTSFLTIFITAASLLLSL